MGAKEEGNSPSSRAIISSLLGEEDYKYNETIEEMIKSPYSPVVHEEICWC